MKKINKHISQLKLMETQDMTRVELQ